MIVELTTPQGLRAKLTSVGASLISLEVPCSTGTPVDVVLGFANEQAYLNNDAFMGATVGRCVNRIAGASFDLDGTRYTLDANDGDTCNHSGHNRWSERIWNLTQQSENTACFELFSPDGDQGFPADAQVQVYYELYEMSLAITIAAAVGEKTLINCTNHSYFNLNGHASGSALNHTLTLAAKHYLPTDATHLPTGELCSVANTAFDFCDEHTLAERLPKGGYDHCFALDGDGVRPVGRLIGNNSGICMDISTNQAGLQLYTANFLNGIKGKDDACYCAHDAVCLECAGFPDAIHHPLWPSLVVTPEKPYESKTILSFSMSN